jgi:hypothetical protein
MVIGTIGTIATDNQSPMVMIKQGRRTADPV